MVQMYMVWKNMIVKPYKYIDGHPDFIKDSEYIQDRSKINYMYMQHGTLSFYEIH